MPPGFYVARGPMKWLIERLGFAAMTTPWRRVYMLEAWAEHPGLIAHERVHLEQIDRLGPVRFTVLYLWWCCRYGYWQNPLEVEAYRKAPID